MKGFDLFIDRLQTQGMKIGKGRAGGWLTFQCPVHQDDSLSLRVKEGQKGVIFRCMAGCSKESVVEALGLKMSDTFNDSPTKRDPNKPLRPIPKAEVYEVTEPIPDDVLEWLTRPKRPNPDPKPEPVYNFKKAVKRYSYRDEDGKELLYSERFETTTFKHPDGSIGPWIRDGVEEKKKTFLQGRLTPNKWKIQGLDAGWFVVKYNRWVGVGSDPENPPAEPCSWFEAPRRVIYRLPEIRAKIAAQRPGEGPGVVVFIHEGEKDVERMVSEGFEATTNPMGAQKWMPEYSLQLEGISAAVIWCDRDEPGYKHALDVRASLLQYVPSVKIMEGRAGKDLSDHLDAGFKLQEGRVLSVADVTSRIAVCPRPSPAPPPGGKKETAPGVGAAASSSSASPSKPIPGDSGDGGSGRGPGRDFSQDEGGGGEWIEPYFAPWTDAGNAERLIVKMDYSVKWVAEMKRWLIWDGVRWRFDETGGAPIRREVVDMNRRVRKLNWEDEDNPKLGTRFKAHMNSLESASGSENCMSMLRSMAGVPVTPSELDTHLTVIPCKNGVIDLKTSELLQGQKEMLLTKQVPVVYDPDADCPVWVNFINSAIPSPEYRRFLHRWVGYCLTGLTIEQCLLFIYGPPGTGKSTLVKTLTKLMGDYFETIDRRKLMNTKMAEGEVPMWLAKLKGARLVTASECKDSDRIDSSIVKVMTGGDQISARMLFQNEIKFEAHFKLMLTGNYRFQFDGDDWAIARRITEMTLDVPVAEGAKDKYLDDKLWAEREGILAWAVEGARLYFEDGLAVPSDMKAKVEEIRKDMDFIGQFLDDEIEFLEGRQITSTEMFEIYSKWSKNNREWQMSHRTLSAKLRGRVAMHKTNKANVYLGVAARIKTVEMDGGA